MSAAEFSGTGTESDPWVLKTPSLGSEMLMHRDEASDPPVLVCTVGSTVLDYDLRIIEDLHQMLKERGDWVPLGNADEQKPAAEGTVEAWARSSENPIGGWYGLKKGCGAASATRAAGPRGTRTGRSGAKPPEQPNASSLNHTLGGRNSDGRSDTVT